MSYIYSGCSLDCTTAIDTYTHSASYIYIYITCFARVRSCCAHMQVRCACTDKRRRDGISAHPVSIVSKFSLFLEKHLPSMISPIPGLHPGSVFKGHQRSGKNSYPVTVEIKHVDFADSYMCGHLSIGGLVSGWKCLKCFISLY